MTCIQNQSLSETRITKSDLQENIKPKYFFFIFVLYFELLIVIRLPNNVMSLKLEVILLYKLSMNEFFKLLVLKVMKCPFKLHYQINKSEYGIKNLGWDLNT